MRVKYSSVTMLLLLLVLLGSYNSVSALATPCHRGITIKSYHSDVVLKEKCQEAIENPVPRGGLTSRRSFTQGTICTWTIATLPIFQPHTAYAKYGESSTMELPNYIDYLIEKNSQGLDNGNRLYQGADPEVLLKRLKVASERLDEVQGLAETKKWSSIQGLVTGPLGTLGQTLQQVSTSKSNDAGSNSKKLAAQAKQIKATLYGIGQAASAKNGAQCIAGARQAQTELQAFVQLAFE
jgi:hypothetical protein